MIFKQWQQVLDGTKTQTRRPVYPHDYAIRDTLYLQDSTDTNVAVYCGAGGRLKWKTGRTYAVQPGRGKKAVGRIRITSIRRERLGDIGWNDAIAEGIKELPNEWGTSWWFGPVGGEFKSPIASYVALWNDIYNKGAWGRMKDDDCWVLDFEVASG